MPRANQSRRLRRRLLYPAMAAAMLTFIGVAAIGSLGGSSGGPPRPEAKPAPTVPDRFFTKPMPNPVGDPLDLHIPDEVDPLPADGVGPAKLTYWHQKQWRVVMDDGAHYRVTEVLTDQDLPTDVIGHRHIPHGLMTVSPRGDKIGYFDSSATFVVRDLASGEVESLFTWDPLAFDQSGQEASWSSNGRWLLVAPDRSPDKTCNPPPNGSCSLPVGNSFADPVLVDLESGTTVDLPATEPSLMGVPNAGEPLPYRVGDKGEAVFLDHKGDRLRALGIDLTPKNDRHDGLIGSVSPDGRRFAKAGTDYLRVVDLDDGQITAHFRLDNSWPGTKSVTVHGWQDADRVLVELEFYKELPNPAANGETTQLEYGYHILKLTTGELFPAIYHTPAEKNGHILSRIESVAYARL